MTNDKAIAKFKQIGEIVKEFQSTPNWYSDELARVTELYRSPNGDLKPSDYNRLRFQLDHIALDIVLKILDKENAV